MCGRVVFTGEIADVVHHFRVGRVSQELPAPSWNVAPSQNIAVILRGRDDEVPRLECARWGLVPPWSESLRLPYPTFNARVETAATKPTFRAGVRAKRCAIVVDGYYEWHTQERNKTPYYVHSAAGSLVLAGLYGWWHDPAAPKDSGWHLTATVLTAPASQQLAWLHHRMPIPLSAEFAEEWLDRELQGDEHLLGRLTETAENVPPELSPREVAPLRGDGPELLLPLTAVTE